MSHSDNLSRTRSSEVCYYFNNNTITTTTTITNKKKIKNKITIQHPTNNNPPSQEYKSKDGLRFGPTQSYKPKSYSSYGFYGFLMCIKMLNCHSEIQIDHFKVWLISIFVGFSWKSFTVIVRLAVSNAYDLDNSIYKLSWWWEVLEFRLKQSFVWFGWDSRALLHTTTWTDFQLFYNDFLCL